MERTARMFIAARLEPEALDELERTADELKRRLPCARFVSKANYHITLAFLGETPPRLAHEIHTLLEAAARNVPPIPAALGGLGYFGAPRNAILWCGLERAEPLVLLGDGIRARLAAAGIPYDPKPIRAHITLARKADVTRLDLGAFAPAPLEIKICAVSLYESARAEGVLTYTPLVTQTLGGGFDGGRT